MWVTGSSDCGNLPTMATTIPERSGDLSHHATRAPITRSAHSNVELSVGPMAFGELFLKPVIHCTALAGVAGAWLKRVVTALSRQLGLRVAEGLLDYLEVTVAEE